MEYEEYIYDRWMDGLYEMLAHGHTNGNSEIR